MRSSAIRLASYNLQKCVGLDLRRRPDRSLQVIAGLQAQIVVLQEADKRLPPRPAALPAQMARDAGWQVVEVGEPGGSLGWHGNAMLLAPGLVVRASHHLDLPGLEPRGAIRIELDTPLGQLRVIGVHLGLVKRFRLLQLAAIMRNLRHLPRMPTVVAGDFNDWGAGRDLDAQVPGLHFVPPAPSFPSPRPVAALDRFLISDDLRAQACGVHVARPARIASDHLPVWVDLARG
ncbi:endonuclease/exonuclease/phosphatase family protein [Lutimaribacter sp. EGI FJ00015]|uniref:Endonuclease/exonuclease/phosphatase family protein n=1 Tax=Lutimaribacter degradans TaxID=2945989 RepID=A0ACC5ZVP8_9RHOB|nr:endonuclease/exonuclease/phosphatase family protein [Lutimaribacter sp. EGI FJ00013]MCM2562126.1 endonuclease/exonuclease/phosphatase family protein [Lutimaribacter sp. EGI FJ00013]MCO0613279.1 endonuclease/exonuclease/phosphatase family protein [Lutimaribacter sp. EGI FJ00015]MCO0636256.1 endonuclease/exonuclease/phosphatase family protein [Lutimaribacter sp. EGI FJ00014]